MGLSEPALSLTDLALGLVVIALAVRSRHAGRPPVLAPHVLAGAAAALAGAVHHGVVTYSDTWSGPSWAVISMMVVVAVSYLLAASVVEVLGPGAAASSGSSARPGWSPTPAWRSRATPG